MTEQTAAAIVLWMLFAHIVIGFITAIVILYNQWKDGIDIKIEDLTMALLVIAAGIIVPVRAAWIMVCDYITKNDQPLHEVVVIKGKRSTKVFNHLKNTD